MTPPRASERRSWRRSTPSSAICADARGSGVGREIATVYGNGPVRQRDRSRQALQPGKQRRDDGLEVPPSPYPARRIMRSRPGRARASASRPLTGGSAPEVTLPLAARLHPGGRLAEMCCGRGNKTWMPLPWASWPLTPSPVRTHGCSFPPATRICGGRAADAYLMRKDMSFAAIDPKKHRTAARLSRSSSSKILSRERGVGALRGALFRGDPRVSCAAWRCAGRRSLRNITAPIDVPPFDRLQCRGFAVRSATLRRPAKAHLGASR